MAQQAEQVKREAPTRVSEATPADVNDRIRRQTEANILYYAQRLDLVDSRLRELEQEWDVGRLLMRNAGVLALAGVAFGLFSRRWNILAVLASGFLIQHAVEGWSPPVSLMRRMGVRTAREIEEERHALKAARGDYEDTGPRSEDDIATRASKAMRAAGLPEGRGARTGAPAGKIARASSRAKRT